MNIFNAPQVISSIDELLQIILFASWIFTLSFSGRKIIIDKNIIYVGIAFLSISSISLLYNVSGLFNFIQFIIIYLRPIFMVLLAATIFSTKDVPFIIKNVVVLFVIQLVLNFTWTVGINPIPHHKIYIDINTGTFESVAPVAYMSVLILYYLISVLAVDKKNRYNRRVIYLFIGVAILQLFFTFTTHAFLLGMLSLLALVLINKRFVYYVGVTAIVLLLAITSLSSFEQQNFHGTTADLISPQNLMDDRFERLQQSIKFASLYIVATGRVPEIKSPLLGAGPGMYGSIVASRGSELYEKYNDTEALKEAGINFRDTTSVTGEPYSGFLAILGDIGWLGFTVYLSIYFFLFNSLLVFVKSKKHYLTLTPSFFVALIPSLLFYLILDFIYDMGAFKIMSIGLWIWAGIALKEIFRINKIMHLKYNIKI